MASAARVASACVASACVAPSITHLISVEMIEGLISSVRMWTSVAVMWIEAVINVAVEVVGAVEPRAGSDEHTVVEPLGPVVSVRGAVVWGEVVKAIRASRLCSDVDGDLGGCRARDAQQSESHYRKGKEFPIAHEFLLTPVKGNLDAKVVMAGKDGRDG
jgi:hypothetical protein